MVISESARVRLRRIVFIGVIISQLALVLRAYSAPHKEFGFQMFPQASSYQAEIVRVTLNGDRLPVDQPWFGYEWNELVPDRGLAYPWQRQHADDGLDNQLAFLDEALAWVAANTPRDTETRYYEATVTTWFNMRGPSTNVVRSPERNLR